MIDSNLGMEAQDMSIFNLIVKNRKGCVLVANKWDLFDKDKDSVRKYTEGLKARIAPFDDVPIIFTSVLKMQRIQDVLNAAEEVAANYSQKIPTSKLNEALLPEIENYPPPSWKGKYIKIKYITQLPTKFPAFVFFANLPQYVKDPYKRFLENQIRKHFNFTGCPIQVYIRQK
jgi:GTP-binding protein